ncbi:MAG: STAS domain-containing protein, partial [Candidatus Sericytochromatia bacterium]
DMFGPSAMPLDELKLPAEQVPPSLSEKLFLYHLEGPLFFGTSRQFSQSLDEIGDYQAIVFSFRDVPFLDQSAAYALEDAITSLKGRGLTVYVSGLRPQPAEVLRRLKVIPGQVDPTRVRPTTTEAVQALLAERPELAAPT